MARNHGLSRRAFLRNAGMTAIAGATGTAVSPRIAGAAPEGAADDVFDFDTPYDRVGTDCIKWDEQMAKFGKENVAVGMGIADMDFKAAPCIGRAVAERCKHENWGYLKMPASFTDAIVAWNKKRYGLEIDPETVVISTGVHPALIAAMETFSPPGSRVLLTTPSYNGFYSDLEFCRVTEADSPMRVKDGRYSIDFDDFERRISHDTHVFVLCNPQNPTGNCWSPEDLMRLGEICLERRVVVLADEIHCDFVMKGQKYTPFASLPNKAVVDNSITFKAASKTFSLAAMKTAWFFSTNPELLKKVKANHRADISTLGVVANQAALMEGAPWLDQLLPYLDANHEFAERYIREKMPLVKYTKAQGTYLAWLDVSPVVDRIGAKAKAAEASKTSEKPVTPEMIFQKWLAENAKVVVTPGPEYGTGGEGYVRMSLGTSRKLIELALNNMSSAFAKL
jgi:cysteine-S-conjugate beta-lyase